MLKNNTYLGTGTTLSSSYYLRNFYTSNRNARLASNRKSMDNSELTLADGMALRRAVKKLNSLEFTDEKDTDIRNSVKAFIQTYNHALASTSDSTDHTLKRTQKQLKSILREYSDSLDKIGVTVNDDGTLTQRDALFSTASLSKFEQLFSSGSDFIQRTSACAKRIERRSDALCITKQQQKLLENDTIADAQSLSGSTNSDALLPAGVGQNINVVL